VAVNTKTKVNKRLKSGEILDQKAWMYIKELNSFSEERLNSVALIDGRREYKYRQMFRWWERYAAVFSALGMTGHDHTRVAMTGVPCSETVFAFYALNMTGASVSMVYEEDLGNEKDWASIVSDEHITDLILADCGTTPELLRRIMKERAKLGIRNVIVIKVPHKHKFLDGFIAEEARRNYKEIRKFRGVLFMDDLLEEYDGYPVSYGGEESADAAIVVHTTGTTKAIHKPVPMSDKGINESSRRLLLDERFEELQGTAITCLNLNVSLGYAFFEMMCLPLAFGGKLVTVPIMGDISDAIRYNIHYKSNVMFGTPHIYERLAEQPMRFDYSAVRFLFMGAGYVSLDAKKRFDKFLKECGAKIKVSVGYGLTELGGVCVLSPEEVDHAMIGYPLPGVTIKLYDEEKEDYFDIEDGPRTGGLLIHSECMSDGYLEGRQYFELKEIDGVKYLETNDLVDLNEDGSLSFIGRTNKYFVYQEGKTFKAGLVEAAVSGQPGIESCGVAPVFDKGVHDTVPVLYVQVASDTEKPKAALTNALRGVYIEGGMHMETDLPSECVITDHIPYNELGKVNVHKILTKEIKGKTYKVEPQYTDDVLTDIKLVKSEFAPGQMRPRNKR